METYGLVVIGSGPGGIAAATAYRDAGGAGQVLVLSADEDPPYQRPPLSKDSLRSTDVPEATPLDEHLRGLQLRLGAKATGIDTAQRTVDVGGTEVRYGALVLATGATPVRLPHVEHGVDHHMLRTFADLRALHQAAAGAESAVVVGSGFIGCEAAASLAIRGVDVTVVTPESGPQRERLGEYVSKAITGWLEELSITVRPGLEVTEVQAPRIVRLSDGTEMEPDLLVVVIGVQPCVEVMVDSGLHLDQGRVVVDEHLQTAHEGVYAVGDVALARHALAGRAIPVEHWGDAEAMGRIAGRNAAGADHVWRLVPGFWSEIGEHTLMYAAWGDGYDRVEVAEGDGAFTAWYADRDGALVGVLASGDEQSYERGRELIEQGASLADALQNADL